MSKSVRTSTEIKYEINEYLLHNSNEFIIPFVLAQLYSFSMDAWSSIQHLFKKKTKEHGTQKLSTF